MLIEIIVDNDFAQHADVDAPVNDNGRENIFKRKRKFKTRLRENGEVKPRDPIPIDESETSLCTALWRSVVMQALYDIAGGNNNLESKVLRADAFSWFNQSRSDGAETDFEHVCSLANLEPCRVLKMVREVKEKGGDVLEGGLGIRNMRRSYASRRTTPTTRLRVI